jgi:phosphomevalonate kinase
MQNRLKPSTILLYSNKSSSRTEYFADELNYFHYKMRTYCNLSLIIIFEDILYDSRNIILLHKI